MESPTIPPKHTHTESSFEDGEAASGFSSYPECLAQFCALRGQTVSFQSKLNLVRIASRECLSQ